MTQVWKWWTDARALRWLIIIGFVLASILYVAVASPQVCHEEVVAAGATAQVVEVCELLPLGSVYALAGLLIIAALLAPDISEISFGLFTFKQKMEQRQNELENALQRIELTATSESRSEAKAEINIFRGMTDILASAEAREALASHLAAAEIMEARAPLEDQLAARAFREDLEKKLNRLPEEKPTPKVDAKSEAEKIAKQYEEIRKSPRSRERTYRMTQKVIEARELARVGLSPEDLGDFPSASPGERIVQLALVEANPQETHFSITLEGIDKSKSRFEQYHALSGMEKLVDTWGLGQAERERLWPMF